MPTDEVYVRSVQSRFLSFLETIPLASHIVVVCHNDVDGLTAGAILGRSLGTAGRHVSVLTTGKAQTPWSPEILERLAHLRPAGLIVADFSPRPAPLLPGVPTLIIDHHRPEGTAAGTAVITGYGEDPTPTSGLLAFWATGGSLSLRWLAALSILGDLAEPAGFIELEEERAFHGQNVLREATSLLNAPRRTSDADARPALAALLKAQGPREIVIGEYPEIAHLKAARREVQEALQQAKMAAPKFSGTVALVRIHTPCQVHPIMAQIWKSRLKKYVVMCANTGYRSGFVHFSVRSATDVNLLDLLREWAPAADADENYGGGHDQATGGALRTANWNQLLRQLGFGQDALVA